MTKASHHHSTDLRLRREVIAYFGVLAVLFQILMPITSAMAADLSGLTQSGQNSEVICVAGGRLVAVNGDQSDPNLQTTACEFCRICQFTHFGQIAAPKSPQTVVRFTPVQVTWAGHFHNKINTNTEYADRPVRAPPYFI
jgi:hypothetical protein